MIENVELAGRAIDWSLCSCATSMGWSRPRRPTQLSTSGVPFRRATGHVAYIETALEWVPRGGRSIRDRRHGISGEIIGSTRFFNLERWAWPPTGPEGRRGLPDACEIGYTWLRRSAIRTGQHRGQAPHADACI